MRRLLSPLRAALLACLSGVAGCERLMIPSTVNTMDVDSAMAKGNYKVACVGLKMKDDELRTYTAQQLAPVPDPVVDECLCTALQGKDGEWDAAVAEGLRGAVRDEAVTCLVDLVLKPEGGRRPEALKALGRTKAPLTRTTIAKIAAEPGDAALRMAAVALLAGDRDQKSLLIRLLAEDSDKGVRAAAAASLGGLAATSDADTLAALSKATASDAEGDVRAQALAALRQGKSPESVTAACAMMMDDPSPAVRQAAVLSFRGTRKPEEVACLRKRALAKEEDAAVRQAMLDTLKGSPSDEAPKVLCEMIPFWLKNYLDRGTPEQVPGTDVIRAQNDRDWESSYACVNKARNGGGYSCYARQYVSQWYSMLGGTTSVPKCPPGGG